MPTAKLIGAPTETVPKNPKPMMPYLFQRLAIMGCFFSATSLDRIRFLADTLFYFLHSKIAIKPLACCFGSFQKT